MYKTYTTAALLGASALAVDTTTTTNTYSATTTPLPGAASTHF